MKKFMILLFVLCFAGVANAYYDDIDGTDIQGTNYCASLDRANAAKVTRISFIVATYDNSGVTGMLSRFNGGGSYYRVSTVVVGYPSVPFMSGQFNGREVGVNSDYFKCPKQYSYNASDEFTAGRIVHWLIPTSYVNSTNSINVKVESKTATYTNLRPSN